MPFDPAEYDDDSDDRWIDYRRLDPGGEGKLVVVETPDGDLSGFRFDDYLYLGDPLVSRDGETYLVSSVRYIRDELSLQYVTLSKDE